MFLTKLLLISTIVFAYQVQTSANSPLNNANYNQDVNPNNFKPQNNKFPAPRLLNFFTNAGASIVGGFKNIGRSSSSANKNPSIGFNTNPNHNSGITYEPNRNRYDEYRPPTNDKQADNFHIDDYQGQKMKINSYNSNENQDEYRFGPIDPETEMKKKFDSYKTEEFQINCGSSLNNDKCQSITFMKDKPDLSNENFNTQSFAPGTANYETKINEKSDSLNYPVDSTEPSETTTNTEDYEFTTLDDDINTRVGAPPAVVASLLG